MQRPTFNVTEFQEVIHVQMNDAMRHLLVTFINEVDQTELEAELRAFRNALRDPEGALERKFRSSTNRRKPYRDNYDRDRVKYGVPDYEDRGYPRDNAEDRGYNRDRYEDDE